MIKSELLKDRGVLIITPVGPLASSDFEGLASEIDPYIEQNGRLNGLMIDAPSFPGWSDFSALLSHLKFVKEHHRQISKAAAVSDSKFLSAMPNVVGHFVRAEVKHFTHDERDKALAWLTGE